MLFTDYIPSRPAVSVTIHHIHFIQRCVKVGWYCMIKSADGVCGSVQLFSFNAATHFNPRDGLVQSLSHCVIHSCSRGAFHNVLMSQKVTQQHDLICSQSSFLMGFTERSCQFSQLCQVGSLILLVMVWVCYFLFCPPWLVSPGLH